jgi:hypothetical protein
MKEPTYYKLKLAAQSKGIDFDSKYVFEVDTDSIIFYEHQEGNEARINGLVKTNLQDITASVEKFSTNYIPITVSKEISPTDEPLWKIEDGHHRVQALIDAGIRKVRCVKTDAKNAVERKLNQINKNVGSPRSDATTDDIANQFTDLIVTDRVLGNDLQEIVDNMDVVKDYITDNIDEAISGQKMGSILKKIKRIMPQGARNYHNYTKKQDAIDKFNEINQMGMTLAGVQNDEAICVDSNGQTWRVVLSNSPTHVDQNGVHYSLRSLGEAADNNIDMKTMLLAYDSNLLAEGLGSMANYERKMTDKASAWNRNPKIVGNVYDGAHRLPQVLKGPEKEDMNTLIELDLWTKGERC